MGLKTDIDYCDSTVNPTAGCDGCELWNDQVRACYAGRFHSRWAGKTPAYPLPFNQPCEMPGRMVKAARWSGLNCTRRPDKPWLNGLPRVIFIGDMADVFSKKISFNYLYRQLIGHIAATERGRRHFWILLTKWPQRAAEFAAWLKHRHNWELPDNLMLMTSVTAPETVWRVGELLKVPCRWHGVSVEPLLGPVDLNRWLARGATLRARIDWVIIGCESRQRHVGRLAVNRKGTEGRWLAWAEVIAADAKAQPASLFVKQIPRNGYVLGASARHAFPESLRFQEMPRIDHDLLR